jgi:arginine deiminase
MGLQVFSEIGRLRRVLIHRPGLEIDWMVPSMMEELLFDDILHGGQARKEHDAFCQILQAAGVETLDPEVLLAESLEDSAICDELLDRIGRIHSVNDEVLDELGRLPPRQLATAVITGLRNEHPRLSRRPQFYRLAPLPNYFFQRDPQVVLGERVLISSMATEAREREPFLARTLFEHHPALRPEEILHLDHPDDEDWAHLPHVEGGDVLIPSSEVVLVGQSERTNRLGIEALARRLQSSGCEFRVLIVVDLPPRRSYMHLDTVFTFIDHGQCLAYMPVIEPGGSEAGHVYRIDLDRPQITYALEESLPQVLADVGLEIELVPCGGADSLIDQQREQWTDGANAFAIAPGVILLYERNERTTDELRQRGYRVLKERQVLDGAEILGQGPTAILLRGNDLSRARGGPRCMTMPLEREPLQSSGEDQ